MDFLIRGESRGNTNTASFRRAAKYLAFFLLLSSLAANARAQQDSQSGYSDGAQNSTDCSDPMQATSPQCSGQNSEDNNSQMTPQPRAAQPGNFGGQTQSPNSNYSDTERLSRQSPYSNQLQRQPLPAEPLTEFQKFVVSTTNQVLPIYGASLFRRVPSTFAPLDLSPVPSDFVIGPGDELRIRIWGQVNFQSNLRVDRSGEIYLPQVGPVHVAGMPFSELDAHLRAAIGRVYRNFDLTADIGQTRAIQVYVAGEARRPGVYTVSSLSTLVDALFVSGGPSLQGSLRHIQLRRNSAVVTDFDLYDLLVRGDKSKDVKLLPGDVIYVPPVGAEVAVTGSVRSPAIYELRSGESMADLLADAGGVSTVAAESRISIERIQDHSARVAMEVPYDATGLATPIAGGDLVRVFSIVPVYKKTVILRGNIANPGRFAWHPGMHVSDLIPDKDSLVTRNYWWKRAQLGLPAPEFEPTQDLSALRQPAGNNAVILPSPNSGETGTLNRYGQQQNQYAQPNLYNSQQSQNNQQNQYGLQQGEGEDEAQQDQYDQYGLQQNDLVNGLQQGQYGQQQNRYGSEQNGNLSAQQRGSNSSVAAQQSGMSSQFPSAQRTDVRQLAPEIDWNYAVIERLDPVTLKTTLYPFDLGKLVLQHDASQDLALQAGDVVSIFSDADIRVPIAQQTKLVTLGGEFVHAGIYSVQPGETLRQLVERAGGLTSDAYLYGSEYARESTRVMQQARIDEYVQNLSLEIQRTNLETAASAISPTDPTGGAATAASERDLIANLRKIRATGRIVLSFTPSSSGVATLPNISMENGDRFFVPSVPATVNVVGSVYNENSFLYHGERTARGYLQLAGGPTRDADWKREFIIRADGEVVSHDLGKGIWTNKFDDLHLYPGDTIVVPEKAFKPSSLRSVIEWSSLVSNFALGAAALSVVR